MTSLTTTKALVRKRYRSSRSRVEAVEKTLVSLGWEAKAVREVPGRGFDSHLIEVRAANETQALIVVAAAEPGSADRVALGYSREAPYTLYWGAETVALFEPARWINRPGDVPLAEAEMREVGPAAAVVELLQRDSILHRIPSSYRETGTQQKVLHEKLADALSGLRLAVAQERALEGENPSINDPEVLRLFHQLLFIRFEEDWHRAVSSQLLADIQSETDPHRALQDLLQEYSKRLNSELFAPTAVDIGALPTEALSDVLQALTVPWESLRLNFSVSRAEIAGRLYQSYLRQMPKLSEDTLSRATLFPTVVGQDEREQHAAYYTPAAVARYLTERTLGHWLSRAQPADPAEIKVLDPACGSGTFLIASFRLIVAYFESRFGARVDEDFRLRVLTECIFGADIDASAVGLAQVQLLEEVGSRKGDQLPALGQNLFVGDSLLAPPGVQVTSGVPAVPWDDIMRRRTGFDVVLMNPPFVTPLKLSRRLSAEQRSALRNKFPEVRAWGSDYAYYFLALALRLTNPAGEIGSILPRTILVGDSGAKAREAMSDRGVRTIVDFRGLRLFEDVASYVTAVSLGGGRVTEVAEVADSRLPADLVLDSLGKPDGQAVRRLNVPRRRIATAIPAGWGAFRLRWDVLRRGLTREWEPLSSAAGAGGPFVVHGTQAGDERRMTVAAEAWEETSDSKVVVQGIHVDPIYVPRVVRGAGIHPFRVDQDGSRLLVPYESDGRPAPDSNVQSLLQRLGANPRHPQPGNLTALRNPKVLIRRFGREPSAFYDAVGDLMITKGSGGALAIGIVGDDAITLQAIEALVHASLFQWLLRGLGSPRADETIELSAATVAALPWPRLTGRERRRLVQLGKQVRDTLSGALPTRITRYWEKRFELDEYVLDLFGATEELRGYISEELIRQG